jgi:hypothetical protein
MKVKHAGPPLHRTRAWLRTMRLREIAADNPLAGRPWGVYQGDGEMAWAPYARAGGEERALLGKIALAPKAKWFGGWISNGEIAGKVRGYIDASLAQAGSSDALVQMSVFRMHPWEDEACRRLPTAAEASSYRDWIDRFAGAVGDAHAAIVLQPDGPFALCAPHGSTAPSELIAYSARVLSALPHTSVYIDVGAADWPIGSQGGVAAATRIAVQAVGVVAEDRVVEDEAGKRVAGLEDVGNLARGPIEQAADGRRGPRGLGLQGPQHDVGQV